MNQQNKNEDISHHDASATEKNEGLKPPKEEEEEEDENDGQDLEESSEVQEGSLVCPSGEDEIQHVDANNNSSNDDMETSDDTTAGGKNFLLLPQSIRTIFTYDNESFVLSMRVATSMTLASLFALLTSSSDSPYPHSQWILTSAAVVSWQSYRDTASAVKKAVERTIGTAVGAILGLAIGFLSLLGDDNPNHQASIIGVAIAVTTFAMPYASIRLGLRGSYAARLGTMTFGIVLISFLIPDGTDHPVWFPGVFRAANIMIGCFVALVSLLISPQSTKALIEEKIQAQMMMAGDSSAKVLDLAYNSFVNKRSPTHWDTFLFLGNTAIDPAYAAYTKGIGSWKTCNDLFAMLKYDPFFWTLSKKERFHFHDHFVLRAERAFRITINLILLDSIVRGGVNLDEYQDSFEVLRDVGQRIQVVLDLRNEFEKREEAVRGLLEINLPCVRLYVQRLRGELSRLPGEDVSLKRVRRSITSFNAGTRVLQELESREQVAFFFELVEHLIIRASRLHYFCQEL